MKPPVNNVNRGKRPRPHMTWVSHPRVSQQLIRHDCSVVGLLADMAKDTRIDPQLRFRVLEKLTTLLYLPSEPMPPVPLKKDDAPQSVADIIADAWKDAPES